MKGFPALLLTMMATAGCQTVSTSAFRPDAILPYKSIGDTQLTLHVFEPPASQASELSARPAIVFFFGGGWRTGHPRQFYPQCAYLASRGMVAISAEYRTEEKHGTAPRECVEDGKSAIRWVRQHASALRVDPGRLAAGGGSAGGHVAAVAGMTDVFNAPDEDLSVSSRPDALVLFNPVIDTETGTASHQRLKDYWREISPFHHVDAHTPPMIFFLGERDHLVSPDKAREFKRQIEAAQGRCDLHIYEGQTHGFFNLSRGSEYFSLTVTEADRFLQSLGYLPEESHLDVAGWLRSR